jgi:hypothetical protein
VPAQMPFKRGSVPDMCQNRRNEQTVLSEPRPHGG